MDKDNNKQKNQYQSWLNYLANTGTISQIKKLDPTTPDTIYKLGYGYYQTGLYNKALQIFRYLAFLNHHNSDYFLAIGYCHYQLENFLPAVIALSHTNKINPNDPRACICLVECFIHLKYLKLAKQTLKEAHTIIKNKTQWQQEAQLINKLTKHLSQL